ncbi:hypothetical protein chiPu_0029060, partial [Chiloscyllium punctatum]|nr:hypothetical protein [Chiloscyllium punctatum]
KCKERSKDRRPVLSRKARQSDFLRRETHARDDATEDRDPNFVSIGLRCRIRQSEQHLACWLFVMPARFDSGELCRLMLMDVVTDQMSEQELNGDEHCRESKTHVHHHPRFGEVDGAQQIPSACCGHTECTGQIRSEQHVDEADEDHPIENDLRPAFRNEYAVLYGVAHRDLHPTVVGHDPKCRQRRSKRYHCC